MTEGRDVLEDSFSVTDAEVRAGRELPTPSISDSITDREMTLLVGLGLLGVGVGLVVAAGFGLLAGLGAGMAVPGLFITAIALLSRTAE